MQLLKLTDEEYFSSRRYSHSDLSELERQMFKSDCGIPENAFRFGSLVHSYVLEGIQPTNTTPEENETIDAIATSLNDNKTFWNRWAFGQKEISVFWETEGLPLKSKLDLLATRNGAPYTISDLKTTNADNYKQFLRELKTFNYHRQAAFYLDSVAGKRYEIWAVQKKAPFHVFQVVYFSDSPEIQEGRKKYRRLLRAVHEQNFIPTKWNQEILSCF